MEVLVWYTEHFTTGYMYQSCELQSSVDAQRFLARYKSVMKSLFNMHHLTCRISSLLRSVNLILFTVLLVHLILCISPHHSHHLHSHHLSLPQSFTPDFFSSTV